MSDAREQLVAEFKREHESRFKTQADFGNTYEWLFDALARVERETWLAAESAALSSKGTDAFLAGLRVRNAAREAGVDMGILSDGHDLAKPE
jgi:hypothetical protein